MQSSKLVKGDWIKLLWVPPPPGGRGGGSAKLQQKLFKKQILIKFLSLVKWVLSSGGHVIYDDVTYRVSDWRKDHVSIIITSVLVKSSYNAVMWLFPILGLGLYFQCLHLSKVSNHGLTINFLKILTHVPEIPHISAMLMLIAKIPREDTTVLVIRDITEMERIVNQVS